MTLVVVILAGLGAFVVWRFGVLSTIVRLWHSALKFCAWCLGIAIALAVGWSMYGIAGLMLVALGLAVSWWASLFLKEWTDCPACGGGSKHRGAYARSSFSLCGRCEGTSGRVVRPGVRIVRPARARELLASAGVERPMWRG